MFYKNISHSAKTFHGVTFEPGETKEVSEVISNKFMIIVDPPAPKKEQTVQQKPSPEKPKNEAPKEENKPEPKKDTKASEKVEAKDSESKESKS